VDPDKVMEPGLYVATIILEGDDETENSPQEVRVEYDVPPPTLEILDSQAHFLVDIDDIRSATYSIGIANSGSGGDITWEATENCCWLSIDPCQGDTSSQPYAELVLDANSLQSGDCMTEGWQTTTVTIEATIPDIEDAYQTVEVRLYIGELDYVYLPMVAKH
jgi:hypothetical protein